MQLINPKSPSKNGVKQMETTQEKLFQSSIFYPVAKDLDPSNGVKMQQKSFFVYNSISASNHSLAWRLKRVET